jgi:hypothetical protein|uniref:Uncharacterized protein n=1 Tax=Podoviridae sp. ctYKD14 TaxID=2827740 RepID=A0A8S5S5C2_9CAUD|nr:MAG TPA: hypothetical protein [Podoviridae sp. ctYKD14]
MTHASTTGSSQKLRLPIFLPVGTCPLATIWSKVRKLKPARAANSLRDMFLIMFSPL